VVIQSAKDLGIETDRINADGGAIALGHPVGASGARLVLHQALALQRCSAVAAEPELSPSAAAADRATP
jgi:acetyl-CoA acetyltransferase